MADENRVNDKPNAAASRADASLTEILLESARLKRQSAELLKRAADLDDLIAKQLIGRPEQNSK